MHGVARIRGSSGDTCRVGRCELGISQVALSQGYDKYGNFSLSSEDAKMSRRWVSHLGRGTGSRNLEFH